MITNKSYFLAIYQIIRTGHWITDQVHHALRSYGITEPQYNVLRVLHARKGRPISVKEIQQRMVQRNSNVSRLIDKLMAKGYVDRHENPFNRRKVDIIITEKGEEALPLFDKKVHAFHEPMSENLSREEALTLTKLIIKLKGDLDD